MAYRISEECLACGVCTDDCPAEAISEGKDKFIIDAELCTDCGNCAEICPNESASEG